MRPDSGGDALGMVVGFLPYARDECRKASMMRTCLHCRWLRCYCIPTHTSFIATLISFFENSIGMWLVDTHIVLRELLMESSQRSTKHKSFYSFRGPEDLSIGSLHCITSSLVSTILHTMGWFPGSSSPSPPAPKISADGTPIAPGRSERAKCWEARDIYFKCLDNHDIVDSIKEGEKAAKECAVEGKGFEANCATSWVSAVLLSFGRGSSSVKVLWERRAV